jgi:hypothetical protein
MLFQAREAMNLFGIVEAAMRVVAQERQNDFNILAVYVVLIFDSFRHEAQNFQTTEDQLMFPRS